jgi:cytochrome c55X
VPKYNGKALGDWIQLAASVAVIGGFAGFAIFAVITQLNRSQSVGQTSTAAADVSGGLSKPGLAEVTQLRQAELRDFIAANCQACHGAGLAGGSIGPPLTPAHLAPLRASAVATVILHGRLEKGMPAWERQLTDADALWIAEFLK